MNSVSMIGRLTRDMDVKIVGANSFAIGEFSIAVNRRTKRNGEWVDEVSFFNCKLLGKRATGLAQYMTKGKQIGIEAEAIQERWEKNGIKNQKIVFEVSNIDLLGGNTSATQTEEMFKAEEPRSFNEDLEF